MHHTYRTYAWPKALIPPHPGEAPRGLDFVGTRVHADTRAPNTIGIHVHCAKADTFLSQDVWRQFLAESFICRLDHAIFITTGRISPAQWKEATQARVTIIEGVEQLQRIADTLEMPKKRNPTP